MALCVTDFTKIFQCQYTNISLYWHYSTVMKSIASNLNNQMIENTMKRNTLFAQYKYETTFQ